MSLRDRRSGFVPLPKKCLNDRCTHPQHNPPTHIIIPYDKIYVHVCPACHQETHIPPSNISWTEEMQDKYDLEIGRASTKTIPWEQLKEELGL